MRTSFVLFLALWIGVLSGWPQPGGAMALSTMGDRGMTDCPHTGVPSLAMAHPARHALPLALPLCCVAAPVADIAVAWDVAAPQCVLQRQLLPISERAPPDSLLDPELPPPRI